MPTFRNKQIQFKASFLFGVAVCILIVPIKWLLSWLAAVVAHEFSHYLALKIFNVQIYSISLSSSGVVIKTEPMPLYKEVISALAGPLGGFCILILARSIPVIAICAFFQSVYNFLPIYPLDGGRVLRCCFLNVFGCERGDRFYRRFECVFTILIVMFSVIFSLVIRLPLLAAFASLLVFKDKQLKFPCKEGRQIVQ